MGMMLSTRPRMSLAPEPIGVQQQLLQQLTPGDTRQTGVIVYVLRLPERGVLRRRAHNKRGLAAVHRRQRGGNARGASANYYHVCHTFLRLPFYMKIIAFKITVVKQELFRV